MSVKSPYFKVFHRGKQLTHKFTRLRYVEAEEEDDTVEITIESDNVNILQNPEFNEKEPWVILFGFVGEPNEFKGLAYIEDTVPTFDKDGVKVQVTLHDKASHLKKVKSTASYGQATLPGVAYRIGKEQDLKVVLENPGHTKSGAFHYVKNWEAPKKIPEGQTVNIKDVEYTKGVERFDYSGGKAQNDKLSSTTNSNVQVFLYSRNGSVDDYIDAEASKEATVKGVKGMWKVVTNDFTESEKQNIREANQHLKKPTRNPFSPPDFKDPIFQRFAIKVNPQLRAALESGRLDPTKVDKYLEELWFFKQFQGLAQGNKSHTQMLQELARRQRGNYRVIGHGDSLIIRKRNFNQTPVAEYNYTASRNSPIEFVPVTKNKSQRGQATAVSYSGWDKKKKKAFSGVVTSDNAQNKKEVKTGGGVVPRFVPGASTSYVPYSESPSVKAWRENLPSTNKAPGKPWNYFPGGITQITPTLPGGAPSSTAEVINNVSRHIISPDGSVEAAADMAGNAQQDASEKLNPARLNTPGNVLLRAGKMVTVLGVGEKYNMNYYITKVVHELSQDTAYTCTSELITNTQGKTFKLGGTKQFLKASDKIINTKVRDSSPFDNTKRTVRSNSNGK